MSNLIWHDYRNAYDEKIQEVGDVTLNLDYWDCECEQEYIHSTTQRMCHVCGAMRKDLPPSRDNEVQAAKARKC